MDRRDEGYMNRRSISAGMFLATICLAGCTSLAGAILTPKIDADAATLASGDFVLDTAHAALLFRINHLGFADYAGRFDHFEASLSGDAATPAEAKVEAIIDISSLNIANPEFAEELLGPGWFDVGAHPQAIFRSRSIELTGETAAIISGDLTLKGVTKPITLSARLNGSAYDPLRGADVIGFSATSQISRADFGIDRFSGLLTDTVRIEIEAEFVRQAPD